MTELVFREHPYIEMERLQKEAVEAGINALVTGSREARCLLEIADVDLQACGGTHVRNTSEIGRVEIARIRSEGKRNKRVTLVLP